MPRPKPFEDARCFGAGALITLVACLSTAFGVLVSPAFAQRPPADKVPALGTISGRVTCADTNSPARMATVAIELESDLEAYTQRTKDSAPIHITSVRTSLDGSFLVPKVPPGSYYIFASSPGYLSVINKVANTEEQLFHPDKKIIELYRKNVPHVSVQSNQTAQVDLLLERGSAVSGTVLFDDGSPAAGLAVKLLVKQEDKWVEFHYGFSHVFSEPRTDDRGTYRIANLPPREYLLQVDLEVGGKTYTSIAGGSTSEAEFAEDPTYSIPVYTGGLFSTRDAKPFTLGQGEERPGEDLQIPLTKLHRLTGNIVAAADGHVLNSGEVDLLTAGNSAQVAVSKLTLSNNYFNFSFVPEGDYVLRAYGEDVEYIEKGNSWRNLHPYSPSDLPIHIDGDKTGVVISLPESSTKLP